MKVLFIGGTGNISSAVRAFCINKGVDLYLLNRGNRKNNLDGAKLLTADVNDPLQMTNVLKNHYWDVVVNWIAFEEKDINRDYELFRDKTKQYIFISSASCYQKPLSHPVVTESTPISNPYWQYSRNKIGCELKLNSLYRENGFPITIVRPSLTYNTVIPVPIGGWTEYTIVDRIKKGKKIIVHGDGTSLWTITHADDFAVGIAGLFGHQQAIGNSFHITSDEILTWDQIYNALANAVGAEANIVHIPSDLLGMYKEELIGSLVGDKAVSVIFDNSKIKKSVPEFKAVIPFSKGIRRTLDWFEAEPERMIIKQETNDFMDKVISKYEGCFPK
ncbi:MAG: NAD-dependent epimerase/dehydratase family protein [Ignavibacteriales bacterium]|nr:MAG: NAD-dependent epimerase/dehydratase family protein [Ignavibacteriales bacterium]